MSAGDGTWIALIGVVVGLIGTMVGFFERSNRAEHNAIWETVRKVADAASKTSTDVAVICERMDNHIGREKNERGN